MTYATLQADVLAYTHRSDVSGKIVSWIQIAESMLFRELSIKELQTSTTGTVTSGLAALPTDLNTISKVTCTYGGIVYTLDYAPSPLSFSQTTVAPSYYSIENNQIHIWNAADGQAYTLYYSPKIESLSAANTTNWILDNAYDLYLYASCIEGARYVRNQTEIDRLQGLVSKLIDDVKRYAEKRGQPSSGSLQIKPRRAWTS